MEYRFRELRLEKNMTQKELAMKLNSTDKNIWAYENGVATPPYDVLIAYAKFFEVSTDYILGLEDDFGVKSFVQSLPLEHYTKEEKELITNYRAVDDKIKKIIQDQLTVYSEKKI